MLNNNITSTLLTGCEQREGAAARVRTQELEYKYIRQHTPAHTYAEYHRSQAVSNEKALQQELEHKYMSIKNQIRELKSGDMLRIEGGETIKQNLRVAHSNLQQAKK